MNRLLIFVLLVGLIMSCSSEKVLLERISHDWKINYIENYDANNSFTTIEDYQYVDENSNNDWIDNCSKGAKLFSEIYPQLKI